jgi:hypothetical protein
MGQSIFRKEKGGTPRHLFVKGKINIISTNQFVIIPELKVVSNFGHWVTF